eukprot:2438861-Rhodomonas_salina.4
MVGPKESQCPRGMAEHPAYYSPRQAMDARGQEQEWEVYDILQVSQTQFILKCESCIDGDVVCTPILPVPGSGARQHTSRTDRRQRGISWPAPGWNYHHRHRPGEPCPDLPVVFDSICEAHALGDDKVTTTCLSQVSADNIRRMVSGPAGTRASLTVRRQDDAYHAFRFAGEGRFSGHRSNCKRKAGKPSDLARCYCARDVENDSLLVQIAGHQLYDKLGSLLRMVGEDTD